MFHAPLVSWKLLYTPSNTHQLMGPLPCSIAFYPQKPNTSNNSVYAHWMREKQTNKETNSGSSALSTLQESAIRAKIMLPLVCSPSGPIKFVLSCLVGQLQLETGTLLSPWMNKYVKMIYKKWKMDWLRKREIFPSSERSEANKKIST